MRFPSLTLQTNEISILPKSIIFWFTLELLQSCWLRHKVDSGWWHYCFYLEIDVLMVLCVILTHTLSLWEVSDWIFKMTSLRLDSHTLNKRCGSWWVVAWMPGLYITNRRFEKESNFTFVFVFVFLQFNFIFYLSFSLFLSYFFLSN